MWFFLINCILRVQHIDTLYKVNTIIDTIKIFESEKMMRSFSKVLMSTFQEKDYGQNKHVNKGEKDQGTICKNTANNRRLDLLK